MIVNLFYAALPSAQRLYARVLRQSQITESGFTLRRFREAGSYFRRLGYDKRVVLCSNDATTLKAELVWRQADDALLGFTFSDADLPKKRLYAGGRVTAIKEMVATYPLGTKLEVILINPLDPLVPPYVLAVFCDKQRDAATHTSRWNQIDRLLYRESGLHVLSHACDGDPAQLSAQLARLSAPSDRRLSFCEVPNIDRSRRVVSAPLLQGIELADGVHVDIPQLSFQDFHHVALKLR